MLKTYLYLWGVLTAENAIKVDLGGTFWIFRIGKLKRMERFPSQFPSIKLEGLFAHRYVLMRSGPVHTAELYYIEGYANTYLYKIHI